MDGGLDCVQERQGQDLRLAARCEGRHRGHQGPGAPAACEGPLHQLDVAIDIV